MNATEFKVSLVAAEPAGLRTLGITGTDSSPIEMMTKLDEFVPILFHCEMKRVDGSTEFL